MSAPNSRLEDVMAEMDRILTPQLKKLEASSNSVVEAATSLSNKCKVSGQIKAVSQVVKKSDTTAPYAKQA